MARCRAGKWCEMAETDQAIPAIPAYLRGKKTPIPAGYLTENKRTAGIAGIGSDTFTWKEKKLA